MEKLRPRKVKIQISLLPHNYKLHFQDRGKLPWPPGTTEGPNCQWHPLISVSAPLPPSENALSSLLWGSSLLGAPPNYIGYFGCVLLAHRCQVTSSNSSLSVSCTVWWIKGWPPGEYPLMGWGYGPAQSLFCRKCFLVPFSSSQIKPCNWPPVFSINKFGLLKNV